MSDASARSFRQLDHPYSESLLSFVAAARYEDLPASVIDRAKISILDAIGCAIHGVTRQAPAGTLRFVDREPGAADATCLGLGQKVSAWRAALANATSIHVTEMSETDIRAVAHPGNTVIPAALATAERERASGRDLLSGVVAGFDTCVRFGLSVGPNLMLNQGMHIPSVVGVLGSAVATGRVRRLPKTELAAALGIAATMTPTALFAVAGEEADVKDVFLGWASAAGVIAADLAASGVTGVPGFAEAWLAAVPEEADAGPFVTGSGALFAMTTGRLRIKPRPVMAMSQPTSEALCQMIADEPTLDPRSIVGITVYSTQRIFLGGSRRPVTVTAAKASVAFVAGAMLSHPARVREDPYLVRFFTSDLLHDSAVHRLVDLVELVEDTQFTHNFEVADEIKYEARVVVRTDDGRTLESYADIWPDTSRPTYDWAAEKFIRVSDELVPSPVLEAAVEAVAGLERSDDVSTVLGPIARHLADAAKTTGLTGHPTSGSRPAVGSADKALPGTFAKYHLPIPDPVVEKARASLLDYLGCLAIGQRAESIDAYRVALGAERVASGGVTVAGSPTPLTAVAAAYLHGTFVHATELSETFTRAGVHPGNAVIPAVLAVAERCGASGAEILRAIVLGYEGLVESALPVGAGLLRRGIHTPSFLGGVGAAIGAATVAGRDEDTTRRAASIAACLAPMTLVRAMADGATVKDGYLGLASALGVISADLASEGITTLDDWQPQLRRALPVDVFDANKVRSSTHEWLALAGGLHYKTDDVAAMSQPALAALRALLARRPVEPAEIVGIEVRSSRRVTIGGSRSPQNILAAKTSVPFLVAAAITHPTELLASRFGLPWLEPSVLGDPESLRLAAMVQLSADDEMDRGLEQDWPMTFAARVLITTMSGEVVTEYADIWPSTSTMTFDDVAMKFRAVTRGHLANNQSEELISMIQRFDQLPDTSAFWELLRSTFGATR